METKTFLISGGNFTNKGAQSMLLITISELRQRFRDCNIVIVPLDSAEVYKEANLRNVLAIENHPDIHMADQSLTKVSFLTLKNVLRFLLKKNCVIRGLWDYRRVLSQVDALIDISGFCLSSQFGLDYNIQYLELLEDAQRHHIPVILMPQSFGPFNYKERKEEMLERIETVLSGSQLIFARENEGYELLKETFNLSNVIKSIDMVLQNKSVNMKLVFCDEPVLDIPDIEGSGNVAVIPNSMNLAQRGMDEVVNLYLHTIQKLHEMGKTVYLMYHSDADRALCKSIFEKNENRDGVIFLDRAFSCYEYDAVVQKMDYLVASRYHSIVHAYRTGVPSIILGWAVKYRELAGLFDQEQFVFDVRDNFCSETLDLQMETMNNMHEIYAAEIKRKLVDIQSANCFDEVEKILHVN